jgi:hypothetical protein
MDVFGTKCFACSVTSAVWDCWESRVDSSFAAFPVGIVRDAFFRDFSKDTVADKVDFVGGWRWRDIGRQSSAQRQGKQIGKENA